ncbi:MAG: YlxM family DNA-binding protein [Tepidanaerobacteraceae bacterium]|nr:YlxM family DNA-binding protein [Tepidanaerobacteraceae bacterium]
MDNITKLNLLFDYYGGFLTNKQQDIFELYYLNDLSLGEIAENNGITRQGVYDILRRSQHILYNFEEKLGMVSKYFSRKKEIEEILILLEELKQGLSSDYDKKYKVVYNRVVSLLKEGGG